MTVELNDRELRVVRCVLGIEAKNREIEKYQLELRLDRTSRFQSAEVDNIKERLDVIDDTLPELYALEKKFQEVIEKTR